MSRARLLEVRRALPSIGTWKGNIAKSKFAAGTAAVSFSLKVEAAVTQTSAVSADGKTGTVATKGKNALGQMVDNVNVYDKQYANANARDGSTGSPVGSSSLPHQVYAATLDSDVTRDRLL